MQKRIKVAKTEANVYLLYWDKGKEEKKTNISDVQIQKIYLPTKGNPIERLIPYNKFKKLSRTYLLDLKPSTIHVQGLDMLDIAVNYKINYNPKVKIIYEVADLHRYLVDDQPNLIGKFIKRYLKSKEEKLLESVEKLIITSPKFYTDYFKDFVSYDKVILIENIPDLENFQHFRFRDSLQKPLRVSYIGSIRYKAQLHMLLDIAEELDIKIEIAGFEEGEQEIKSRAITMNNVKWYGPFDFKEDASMLYEHADVIYSVYDADLSNVRSALPNKFYESLYTEKPILVARGTYLAERVENMHVGMAINHHDKDELKDTLIKLNDKEFYQKIKNSCKSNKNNILGSNNIEELQSLYKNN